MDNDIWPKRAWSSTWHLLDHATECGKGEAVARGNSIQRKVEMTLRLFTQPWRAGKHVWERALRVWPSDCVRLRGRGDLLLDTMRTMGVVSRGVLQLSQPCTTTELFSPRTRANLVTSPVLPPVDPGMAQPATASAIPM